MRDAEPRKDETMTDAELNRLTELAMTGELDEAEYDRLTRRAIARGEELLSDPEKLARATADPFVSRPGATVDGEDLFRTFCTRRGNHHVGQFSSRDEAIAAKRWAIGHLDGYIGCRIRTLRNFLPTLGHLVYELRVTVA
jgi:hypothetical protein